MIEIRAKKTKLNGTCVNILRKQKKVSATTQKVSYQFKQLGSFYLEKELIPEQVIEGLEPDELLHLKDWLDDANFSFKFETLAENMQKTAINFPEKLLETLYFLFIETGKRGIHFSPHNIMLDALVSQLKAVSETLGIKLDETIDNFRDEDDKILFRTLITLNQPIGKTCFELEEIAKKLLNKDKKIPPPQLEDWAGIKQSRNANKTIKKWAYSLAIELLLLHNISPITLISCEKVAEYWCLPRHTEMNLHQAIKKFISTFNVPDEKRSRSSTVITQIYLHYQLKNNLLKF